MNTRGRRSTSLRRSTHRRSIDRFPTDTSNRSRGSRRSRSTVACRRGSRDRSRSRPGTASPGSPSAAPRSARSCTPGRLRTVRHSGRSGSRRWRDRRRCCCTRSSFPRSASPSPRRRLLPRHPRARQPSPRPSTSRRLLLTHRRVRRPLVRVRDSPALRTRPRCTSDRSDTSSRPDRRCHTHRGTCRPDSDPSRHSSPSTWPGMSRGTRVHTRPTTPARGRGGRRGRAGPTRGHRTPGSSGFRRSCPVSGSTHRAF